MFKSPYVIAFSEVLTFQQCMLRIEDNAKGFVIILKEDATVFGVLTDGDIRRALLGKASVEDIALPYVNQKFKFIEKGASREQVLKMLDTDLRFIPVLNNGILTSVSTLSDLNYTEDGFIMTRAKAPARISFGGGGTDMTPFFSEHGGAVLSATVGIYSHATLKKLPETESVVIKSRDYDVIVKADDYLSLKYDGQLDLIKAAIKLLKPDFGFELEIRSDFPPNSGLGGSSVVLAAVIGCFNELRRHRLSPYDIAELAFQAERLELKCSGGWQDQYAAVFGGVNFMEFHKERNEINSLRVSDDTLNELEQRLVLCFTGKGHPVGKIHERQKKRMLDNAIARDFAKKSRDIAFEMKFHLARNNLDKLGELIQEAWFMKKTLSLDISNPEIDEVYEFALEHGAIGGKILGAGGGGYFLFMSRRDARYSLGDALSNKGYAVRDVIFENTGLRSWTVRS